jgi:hypothetical protein
MMVSIFGQNPLKDVDSRVFTRMLCGKNLTLWPWKSIRFQTLLRTMYVPSLVKIHWRMLILECSQGCYAVKIWPGAIDLWPWKSIGFQTLLRTKHVHCTKFGQNPLKDLDSRVFTRMLCSKNLTRWHWPLNYMYDLENQ